MNTIKKEHICDALQTKLLKKEYFKDYQWLKSQSKIKHKDKALKISRSLKFSFHWTVADANSDDLGYDVSVWIGIRFDILHKWFEKFCGEDAIKSYRKRTTHSHFISLRDHHDIFFFSNGKDFEISIANTMSILMQESEKFFKKYESLDTCFIHDVLPIIEGKTKFAIVGCSDIFNSLATCRVAKPDRFDELESIAHQHIKQMYQRGEPNAEKFYPMYKNIVQGLKETFV